MTCGCTISGNLPQPCGRLALGCYDEPWLRSNRSLEVAFVNYIRSVHGVSCAVLGGFYPHQVPRTNSTWPAVAYFRQSADHQHDLSGSAGFAFVDIALDIYSPNYLDCLHAAESLRQALDGFQGCWGAVGIYGVLLESESDSVEKAQDGSGTWYYSRSLDYRIMVQESLTQF